MATNLYTILAALETQVAAVTPAAAYGASSGKQIVTSYRHVDTTEDPEAAEHGHQDRQFWYNIRGGELGDSMDNGTTFYNTAEMELVIEHDFTNDEAFNQKRIAHDLEKMIVLLETPATAVAAGADLINVSAPYAVDYAVNDNNRKTGCYITINFTIQYRTTG